MRDDWTRQALINRPTGCAAGRRAMSRRVKPHQVRARELEEVREKDPDGRIVYHHRTVDSLGKMLRAGKITQEMQDAAKDFQAAFIIANLDPLRAIPILRVPGTGREPEINERQLDARRRVYQSLQALGGLSSPAGSCVWHVVGLQRSVREWAIRQGLGRTAGAAGAGARHFGCCARDAGGAGRVRRGQAGLLKDAPRPWTTASSSEGGIRWSPRRLPLV
jgi:hypothetical protein